jgi:hypothetical protein
VCRIIIIKLFAADAHQFIELVKGKILNMKRLVSALSMTFVFLVSGLFAQERQIIPNVMNQGEVDSLIKKVTKNEDDFRYALTNYIFTRKAKVQTVGLGGLITGTFQRDSILTFTQSGERFERILFAPVSTMREMRITKEDIEDLGGVNPFAINPRDVSMYTFSYVGKQRIDEINTHVFDVRPKIKFKSKDLSKRYFIGRIWVDDRDNMIVKSKGKGVPEGDQRFPVVETWRINVDGKYWFPAFSSSDDALVFKGGQVVKIRMRVSYEDYKQGRSDVIVLDEGTEIIDNEPQKKADPLKEKDPLDTKKPPKLIPKPPTPKK